MYPGVSTISASWLGVISLKGFWVNEATTLYIDIEKCASKRHVPQKIIRDLSEFSLNFIKTWVSTRNLDTLLTKTLYTASCHWELAECWKLFNHEKLNNSNEKKYMRSSFTPTLTLDCVLLQKVKIMTTLLYTHNNECRQANLVIPDRPTSSLDPAPPASLASFSWPFLVPW